MRKFMLSRLPWETNKVEYSTEQLVPQEQPQMKTGANL